MRALPLIVALASSVACTRPSAPRPNPTPTRSDVAVVPPAPPPRATDASTPAPTAANDAGASAPVAAHNACEHTAAPSARLVPPLGIPPIRAAVSMDASAWVPAQGAGITWQQPPGLFVTRPIDDGVELWSELTVNAPHGVEQAGVETRHWFRAVFRVVQRPLAAAVCEHATHLFALNFPSTMSGIDPQSAERATVGGRTAWVVESGAHGYDERYVLVEVAPGRSAILLFASIGEYLWDRLPRRHVPLARQQAQIIQQMLATVRFDANATVPSVTQGIAPTRP